MDNSVTNAQVFSYTNLTRRQKAIECKSRRR